VKATPFWTSIVVVLAGFLTAPSSVPAEEPIFAVDISMWSGDITPGEVACWRDSGVRHVISGTQIPSITVQQIQTAASGGMTIDAYVMLYWDFDITAQVRDALATIEGLPVRRLWLDAEQPRGNWSSWQLIGKIQEAIDACGPFPHGIYTRKVWWRDNVDDTAAFSYLPLWYAYYDGFHDFDDWYNPMYWYEGPFGGWTDPTGKQYDSDWTAPDLCNVNLDYNIMYVGAPSGVLNGEVGRVSVNQSDSDHWHHVSLINTYVDPVVIMQPPSRNGGHPSTIRLRNVSPTAFEFQIDEWDYLDGGHISETISYLVMDAGVFELEDGTRVEAGKHQVNHEFTAVTLSQAFALSPVVLSQTQTSNDGAAVVTRQRNVSVSGFELRLQEQEANDPAHAYETVGYIAIEPGTGLFGNTAYEAFTTSDNVTHTWFTIDFVQSYTDPVFIAGVHSFDGGDPVALRSANLGPTGVQIFMEEEQSRDAETNHTTEVAAYIVFDHPGSLFGVGPPPAPTGLSPAGGQTISTDSVTLSCDPIAEASQYEFEIYYSDGAEWQDYYTYTSVTNSQTFWPSYDDISYQWRVRANNLHGWGVWSEFAEFDFGDVGGDPFPPAPTGLTPAGGQTITTDSVTLSCDPIGDVSQYEFEINYSDGVEWQYYYTYTRSTNSQTFWPAYDDAPYRWRVRASNGFGWGPWSDYAEFNFGDVGGNALPPAPTGLSPTNGVTITTSSVTLSCNPVADASQYEFEIHYWNGSSWQYYYTYGPSTSAQTFWPSVHGTSYQWRVRAQNGAGWGPWSAPAEFHFN
jgi:hypothetical protein